MVFRKDARMPADRWKRKVLDQRPGIQILAEAGDPKNQPREARRRREQGTATLVFTVDRRGRVTGVRISKSSGSASLDREVHAMVRRAAPFPPFPVDLRAEQLTLAVPVRFSLR